jgi:hypothetical protein
MITHYGCWLGLSGHQSGPGGEPALFETQEHTPNLMGPPFPCRWRSADFRWRLIERDDG